MDRFLKNLKQNIQGIRDALRSAVNDPSGSSFISNAAYDVNGLLAALQSIAQQQYARSIMLQGLDINKIRASEWASYVPYSLLILKVTGPQNAPKYQVNNNLRFVLPISPQSLTISTVFASQLSVASRGILEEHNGINVKQITVSGTTGTLIQRPTILREKPDGVSNTLFAGVISGIRNITQAARMLKSGKTPPSPFEDVISDGTAYNWSGYYQYHLLRSFLETYAALKRSPEGKAYRLAFEVGKDRAIYLITPQVFQTNRSASSPTEYQWVLQAIAWGTVSDSSLLSAVVDYQRFTTQDINGIQKALNTMRASRNFIIAAKSVISGFASDITFNLIQPLQNIILSLGDIAGSPKFNKDVWTSLDQSVKFNIIQSGALSGPFVPPATLVGSLAVGGFFGLFKTSDSDIDDEVFFKNVDDVSIDSIPLSQEDQDAIQQVVDNAINSVNENTVNNLIDYTQHLIQTLSGAVSKQGSDSDLWAIVDSLVQLLSSLYSLKISGVFAPQSTTDKATGENSIVNFYQEAVEAGGGDTSKPKGKFAIPFPFGTSLEWLARRYLGDATRWHEIAAVNNLKPPYIDEEGFTRSFLANGSGNQFVVDNADKLVLGQQIWIFSDTQKINKRIIKSIQKITDTQYIITVDGKDDLNLYLTSENAKMKAYLPYTVNSQKLIYIPAQEPSNLDATTSKTLPFIEEDQNLLNFSKVDFLLNSDGDIVVTKDGYLNLSYGKQNLMQAARLKMETVAGSLLMHPEYGAGLQAGAHVTDVSLEDLIQRIQDSFNSDPRFNGIVSIDIDAKETGALSLNLIVRAADGVGIVPLEFQLTN